MERTLEDRLRGLFILQSIDLQLDELEAEKGDLPKQVVQFEEKLSKLEAQLQELRSTVTTSKIERNKADIEIISLGEKVEKFKNQQFQVRSNKEYDALTREITHAEGNIQKLQKQMDELEGRMKIAQEDIEKTEQEKTELETQLREKRRELEEVAERNQDEELKLQHEREKILVRIEKADIAMYDRIRKAKGGMAVVSVKRGSCGGCHNRIPPQRLLELRQNTTIYKCEHCGRILISDEIVNTTSITL